MPKTNVYDMTGKQVGEIELSDAVFGIEPDMVAIHEAVKNQLANRPGHAECVDPRGGVWRRPQAVAPEGHRPCTSGIHAFPAVDAWRRGVCSEAQILFLPSE